MCLHTSLGCKANQCHTHILPSPPFLHLSNTVHYGLYLTLTLLSIRAVSPKTQVLQCWCALFLWMTLTFLPRLVCTMNTPHTCSKNVSQNDGPWLLKQPLIAAILEHQTQWHRTAKTHFYSHYNKRFLKCGISYIIYMHQEAKTNCESDVLCKQAAC